MTTREVALVEPIGRAAPTSSSSGGAPEPRARTGRWCAVDRLERLSVALSALLPVSAFLCGGYVQRWAGDDGFINFRVVSQLIAGNGFVFNAGERSEAVTSVAWVFVLWVLAQAGFDVEDVAWVTSLAMGAAGVGLAVAASTRICAQTVDQRHVVLPFGVLVYVSVPVAWDYATSALENGLGLGFLGLAYWLTVRAILHARPRTHCLAALFLGVAPLIRPDYVLYAAPLTLLLMLSAGGWARALRVALCAASLATSYQVFRMGYFAALVPNTALAKEAFESRWDQGFLYLMNTVGTYGLALPLFLLWLLLASQTVTLFRSGRAGVGLASLSMAGAGALHMLYVVRVGGDFMHGRLLLPGLFAMCVSVAAVAVPLHTTPERRRNLVAFALLSAWAIVCAGWLRVEVFEHQILDERHWYAATSGRANPTRLADYDQHQFFRAAMRRRQIVAGGCPRELGLVSLADESEGTHDECERFALPDPLEGVLADRSAGTPLSLRDDAAAPSVVGVFGFRPLGIPGLVAGLRVNVVDRYGLADPLASRMELSKRGRPGHEKAFSSAWFAAKYGSADSSSDEDVAAARRALQCGLLHELHLAVREPLTPERFVENIRLATSLHRLRVPSDPHEAARRFCGAS